MSIHQVRNLSTPREDKIKKQWYTSVYETVTRKRIKTALSALSLITGPILVWHPDGVLEKWGKRIEELGEPFRKMKAKGDVVGVWLRGRSTGVKDAAMRCGHRFGLLDKERVQRVGEVDGKVGGRARKLGERFRRERGCGGRGEEGE